MSRRTYQQAQTWRAAAVALLAEVGVEVTEPKLQGGQRVARDSGSQQITTVGGRATISTYLTGSVSIGGPGPDADYLCEPLERHGLLNGWHPGSRGSGVVWVPQPAKVEEARAIAACTAVIPPVTSAAMVTVEALLRVAAHFRCGSRSIALAELPNADAFAVDTLAFEVRKFADLLEREAERLPPRPAEEVRRLQQDGQPLRARRPL